MSCNEIAGDLTREEKKYYDGKFAILMETQFVICDRKVIDVKQKMNSRLDSLMTILDIQGRKLNDFVISPTEIDYKKVHNRLSPWVQRSQEYLLGCLEGIR